jgi:hypothetical protein
MSKSAIDQFTAALALGELIFFSFRTMITHFNDELDSEPVVLRNFHSSLSSFLRRVELAPKQVRVNAVK